MQVRSVTHVGFAALLFAGLAGCGSKPIDGSVTKVSDLVALCGGRHSTTAAPYAGAPPHPILIVRPQGAVDDMLENPRLSELGPAWNPQDPAAVQLVACTESDGAGINLGLVCQYPFGKSATLRAADYTVTVYEARTSAKVGQTKIEARETCPLSAPVYRQDPVVYATPSPRQYLDALGSFVNRK
ncbi:MAG: hypothetical protein ACRDRX_22990 [Pseudonocardiaceae bacterium]